MPGETRSTLVLDGVLLKDAGTYTVVVGNAGGFVTSQPAGLTVIQDSTPPNLTIADATRTVSTNIYTLSGVASDGGRGDNGVASVTVNGVRANNDVAVGAATANWSQSISLKPGPNPITIVAQDNRGNQTQPLTMILNYQPLPTAPPIISHIPDQVAALGAPSKIINFSMRDTTATVADLIVETSSSNTRLVPNGNIVYREIDGQTLLIIDPTPGETGAAEITITVRNQNGLTANDMFHFTIEPRPPLQILKSGNNILLSWPISSLSYIIEESQDLQEWTTLLATPTSLGDQNSVRRPASSTNKYYRLRLP